MRAPHGLQSSGEKKGSTESGPLTARQPSDSLRLLQNSIGRRLLIAEALTLIIPSVANRVEFLRTSLDHCFKCFRDVNILISDHSDVADRGEIQKLVLKYPELQVRVEHHDGSLHFLERLVACAEVATTRYVVVHADDDCLLPQAVGDCIEFLDQHSDYVACQGRTFVVKVSPPDTCTPGIQRCLNRNEPSASARVFEHCRNFTPTLYAVARRHAFIDSNLQTLQFTQNVSFWQYLSSCLLVSRGKLRTLDDLYYLRLDNPVGWRATLVKERDRAHWPYLVVAPEFSAELEKFKAGLRTVFQSTPVDELADLVDECCLGFVRRAYGGFEKQDAAEVELFERLRDGHSEEYGAVRYFGSAAIDALVRLDSRSVSAE